MYMKVIKIFIFLLFLIFILLHPVLAQKQVKEPKLDHQLRKSIVQSVGEKIAEEYIFPKVAQKIRKQLNNNLTKRKYEKLEDVFDFCEAVTKDIRSINNDRHLRIAYSPRHAERIRQEKSKSEAEKENARKKYIEMARLKNFGFEKVERLTGNVGYLQLTRFFSTDIAGDTAVAAMNFLANTSAVIIDLRTCSGGSPSMVQMLCSYFFKESLHINSFETRSKNEILQSWTFSYVPGKKIPSTDLYILTSKRDFSATEGFAYALKHLKRATIVGEQTRGGAHPGNFFVIEKDFVVFIPTGRAINPKTKTNWEGVGVIPHVTVSAEQALDTAHMLALEKLRKKEKNPQHQFRLDWEINDIKARLIPVSVDEKILEKYIGEYEDKHIVYLKNGKFFLKHGNFESVLLPLSQTLFKLGKIEYIRVEFILDKEGQVSGICILGDNGSKTFLKKVK